MIDKETGEIRLPALRTPYNYDRKAASDAVGITFNERGRTQQHFKDECDINTIVKNFGVTGQLPKNVSVPLQGDFTEVKDYRESLHLMMEADEAFMRMPADVRKRFQNDPHAFLDFVSDPRNGDEARKLGLLVPIAEPAAPPPGSSSSSDPAPK